MASADSASSSTSAFVTSLIVNGIIFLVFVSLFLILRGRDKRIYQPRTFLESVPEYARTETLPSKVWAWLKGLIYFPDRYVLRQTGLDGYFFLRYLKFVVFISAVGILVLFPILLPVNATGGAGQTGLDQLAFSNIKNQKRYYAHVFLSWIYFGFILFMIYREVFYFISVRQAVLTSPYYWNRVSFRTVLFQTIPDNVLNEHALLNIFPEAKNVWINRNFKSLEGKVSERDKLAYKLELAETKLLKQGLKNKTKLAKKGKDEAGPEPILSDYVSDNKRPHHKLKFLIGEKVDTIDYARKRLGELNPEIAELQSNSSSAKKLNSAFIEFNTPEAAYDAYQTVAHHIPLHMAPRFIGIRPEEIIWPNLRLFWWERLIRFWSTTAFLVALIIFWAIPVAAVGAISNITYLTDKVHFLKFILNLPSFLFGLITGLLPTILLAILMALLPIILRLMARIAGAPTLSLVELHVQSSYFAFQVVQVFLITTITSSAASVVTQIISDPTSAMSLLANNLPKSSNFFICYLLLQSLSVAGGAFLQIVGLILFRVLSFILDNTPRKMYARWNNLSALGWGTVFPIYTNLAVISITYSIISPLILIFSCFGFGILFLAYQYNLMFVFKPSLDLTGLAYPNALFQTFTGLYLAEVCLIGLFAVGKNWACIVLVAVFLGFTAFFHITLKSAMIPLLDIMPKSVEMDATNALGIDRSSPAEGSNTTPTFTEKSGSTDLEASYEAKKEKQQDGRFKRIHRFLRPDIYSSYAEMRASMVPDWPVPEYSVEDEHNAYIHPASTAQAPFLWIPKDPYGWSSTEVEKTAGVIGISDEAAHFNEKAKIIRDGLPPDYSEEKHL
ncbi:hypothetical protein V1514DRAFT_370283 [Lipomyces japonicus]|uniref:uncharacterized protein n=1 Tax=Lipomyces japonicus TaxID=56871 RepID=UPI0034CE2D1A